MVTTNTAIFSAWRHWLSERSSTGPITTCCKSPEGLLLRHLVTTGVSPETWPVELEQLSTPTAVMLTSTRPSRPRTGPRTEMLSFTTKDQCQGQVHCQVVQKGSEALHTLEHWLDCPDTLQARLEIFHTNEPLPLSTLSMSPGKLVALIRSSLWRLGACVHTSSKSSKLLLLLLLLSVVAKCEPLYLWSRGLIHRHCPKIYPKACHKIILWQKLKKS